MIAWYNDWNGWWRLWGCEKLTFTKCWHRTLAHDLLKHQNDGPLQSFLCPSWVLSSVSPANIWGFSLLMMPWRVLNVSLGFNTFRIHPTFNVDPGFPCIFKPCGRFQTSSVWWSSSESTPGSGTRQWCESELKDKGINYTKLKYLERFSNCLLTWSE